MSSTYYIIYGQTCNAYEGTQGSRPYIEGYMKSSMPVQRILKSAINESICGGPHGYWPDDPTTQMWTKFQSRPANHNDNLGQLPIIHNASQLFYQDIWLTEHVTPAEYEHKKKIADSSVPNIPGLSRKADLGLGKSEQYLIVYQSPEDFQRNYSKIVTK